MSLSMRLSPKRSVCVFCGSRQGSDPAYLEAANELGRTLAHADLRLVYGAGDVGLMGAVAAAAIDAGGDTFGVIPAHLVPREEGRDASNFIVSETMHERKKVMFMNSDAIVTLPGGAGSLDQLIEVLTWRQLGLHRKPIFLLNVKGYWDPLIVLFEQVISHAFAEPGLRDFYEAYDTVPELMEKLSSRLYRRLIPQD